MSDFTSKINRRQILRLAALAPAMPAFLMRSAYALDQAQAAEGTSGSDANILVVVRMKGGNDGLNALVPIRDDAYYKGRPTIAISRQQALPMPGGDHGLNPALADYRWLMDQGLASITQNVGYPNPSRSHTRATEIFETGSVADLAPQQGWLGRYLDQAGGAGSLAGLEFGDALGRTLESTSRRSRSIANPNLLLKTSIGSAASGKKSAAVRGLARVRLAEAELRETSEQIRRASKASGSTFGYPDTEFGQSLRWTGNMIESGCPTRLYYLTLGSFDTPYSFDTHSDELAIHAVLYSEFGKGLRAFAEHLKKTNQLNRVLLVTFSDFGRQVAENREGGTDHGDASLHFAMGGKLKAGIHGELPDIKGAHDGGLNAKVDFRHIYANVLENWLKVDTQKILGEKFQHYSLIG